MSSDEQGERLQVEVVTVDYDNAEPEYLPIPIGNGYPAVVIHLTGSEEEPHLRFLVNWPDLRQTHEVHELVQEFLDLLRSDPDVAVLREAERALKGEDEED